jgi:hypothetical protein
MAKRKSIGKHLLIIEMTGQEYWGRIDINNNLIIDSASSLDSLKRKIKKTVEKIEKINIDSFEISYDLSTFFEQYSYLNVSNIAKRANISPLLMRQYSAGIKFPSAERVKEIENAIHTIGEELSKVRIHKRERASA